MQNLTQEHTTPSKGQTQPKAFAAPVPVIQKKLKIGRADDPYEVEADALADKVMSQGSIPTVPPSNNKGTLVQKKCSSCKDDEIQKKPLAEQITPLVQRSALVNHGETTVSNEITQQINSSRGGGSLMDGHTQSFMENGFGSDFSSVRIHTDANAIQLSKSLHAQAFTVGNDIYFNEGKYNPNANSGKHLLAHELTHTIQQKGSVQRKIQRTSLVSDGERFLIVNPSRSAMNIGQLVNGVSRRYRLDYSASFQVARWLDRRHRIFNGRTRYDERITIPMPRMVAFFLVDWVEPFNPNGSRYQISRQAYLKAQNIWAQQNVFIGFRRGNALGGRGFEQIDFSPDRSSDGTQNHVTAEEINLLALRSRNGLPAGFFHIVVTGGTTEDSTVAGKSIRSTDRQSIDASSEGILLFAGTFTRLGYQQTVPRGNSGQELGELIAHEIGHFLFNLGHYQPPSFEGGQIVIRNKEDIMRDGGEFDPNDSFGETSVNEIDEAFENGNIPRSSSPRVN